MYTNKEVEENSILIRILIELMKIVKIMGTEGEGSKTIKEDSKIIEVVTMELKINKKMNIKGKKQIRITKQSSIMGMKMLIKTGRLTEEEIIVVIKIRRMIILFIGIILIKPLKIIDFISISLR